MVDGFARSVTEYHKYLVDVAFGKIKPSQSGIEEFEARAQSAVSFSDLLTMRNMVALDFLASVEQERTKKRNDNETESEVAQKRKKSPGVFEVWILRPGDRRTTAVTAVCFPVPNGSGREERPPVWYDQDGETWPTKPFTHHRLLGNVAGPARILESLDQTSERNILPLMKLAMQRAKVVHVSNTPNTIIERLQDVDSMNESQKQAVGALIDPSFKEGFLVLQGPPGCGKTTTLVSMIRNLDCKVLVCAPSNAAVANIALKLIESKAGFDATNTIVYGFRSHQSVRFLSPQLRGKFFKDFQSSYKSAAGDSVKQEQLKADFCEWMHLDTNTTMAKLHGLFPRQYLDSSGDEKAERGAVEKLVKKARVAFCTLNSSGSGLIRKYFQADTLLLDEAGQCSEAEFYIATNHPKVRRIVVLGDPKQLPATVVDSGCERSGYGVSWLSRVYDSQRIKVHLLDTQYRMDPKILDFPNRRFYDNQIQSGLSVINRTQPQVNTPFRFIDMKGRGKEQKSNRSWKNEMEACVIQNLLQDEKDIAKLRKAYRRNGQSLRILVITPYQGQVALLRKKFAKDKSVEVSTVDSFQGQEGDVVVVSTVRTKRVGFIDNPNRLNVALTRAKHILRVVGEKKFFLRLPGGSTLRELVRFADDIQKNS